MEIAGTVDKRQITAVFGGTSTGHFLPIQLIYKGKTCKSLPPAVFPPDWHVTFIDNHWANEKTVSDYLEKILFPYIERKRKELNWFSLSSWTDFEHSAPPASWKPLNLRHVHMSIVPANWTDRLHAAFECQCEQSSQRFSS